MLPVEVRINGVTVDPCAIQLPLSITHGRSDIGSQPDAPSTSVVWEGDVCPYKVGDDLQISAGTAYLPAVYDDPVATYDDSRVVYDSGAESVVMAPHFAGTIAGITASGQGTPTVWQLEAVGYLARLGTVTVNLTRPQETDTARVAAIAAAAGTPVSVKGTPGVRLAAGTVTGDALSALHAVCESTGGLVWQDRAGNIVYGTANHRETVPDPVGVIPCDALEASLSWSSVVEEIVNSVTVQWGTEDNRQEATHEDAASIAEPWGKRAVTVSTLCAAEADADELAVLILARRSMPFWGSVNGVIALDDEDESRTFAALDVSVPVLLPIPAEPGPAPSEELHPYVLEGYVETWTSGQEHIAEAAFSDQKRWVATRLRNWQEVKDGGTYAYWLGHGSYLEMMVTT